MLYWAAQACCLNFLSVCRCVASKLCAAAVHGARCHAGRTWSQLGAATTPALNQDDVPSHSLSSKVYVDIRMEPTLQS